MGLEFSVQMKEILEEYSEELQEKVDKAIEETAKEAVQKLKASSPRSSRKGPHYADGWATKKQGKDTVVYNKTKPGLTHLLEEGFPLYKGGRASNQPHIKPVEEWANREVVRKVEHDL